MKAALDITPKPAAVHRHRRPNSIIRAAARFLRHAGLSNAVKPQDLAPETVRRRAALQRRMADPVPAERRRQRRARKPRMLKNLFPETGQFVPSVIGCVGRADEDRSLALDQNLFDLVETGDRLACPAGEAERVERPAMKARLDILNQRFGRSRGLFEGAGEKPLRNGARNETAVGRNPGAAPAELLSEIRRDDAVRRKGETDQPGGRLLAAPGYAGPRPFAGRLIERLGQRPPPPLRRLPPQPCRDLPASPSRRRDARA